MVAKHCTSWYNPPTKDYCSTYLAWYNPLLGGPRQAADTLPVGWGEGLEEAAEYLNTQPDAEELTVATGGVPGMAPKFRGRTLPLTSASLIEADYVVVYISDRQGEHLSLIHI